MFECRQIDPIIDPVDLGGGCGKAVYQPFDTVIAHGDNEGSIVQQVAETDSLVWFGAENIISVSRKAVRKPEEAFQPPCASARQTRKMDVHMRNARSPEKRSKVNSLAKATFIP